MYKKVIVIILIFLLSGCSKKEELANTVIEQNNYAKIAINYPITHIKDLDNIIDKYINSTYETFKRDYENKSENVAELNIDYTYEILNNYINISLKTFINTNFLAHPINEIFTIVYDKKQNKVLKLGDLINKKELKKLIPTLKQDLIKKYKDCILIDTIDSKINSYLLDYQLFLITKDGLKLYFNPYEITAGFCNIIDITIPFDISYNDYKEFAPIIPQRIEIDSDKPMIALTFDDGPSKYTKKILNLLKENDAVGTFFVMGNKVDIYKDTIISMYENGNEIGNHSYNHKWLTRLSDEELSYQIENTQNIIKKVTNFTPTLLRPTYGSVNNHLRKSTDLNIVLWDVDTNDWKTKNYKNIASRALNKINDGDIILMHDIYERTLKALEIMIPKLKEQGYQFVTVSQLNKIKELKSEN